MGKVWNTQNTQNTHVINIILGQNVTRLEVGKIEEYTCWTTAEHKTSNGNTKCLNPLLLSVIPPLSLRSDNGVLSVLQGYYKGIA